MTRKMVTVFGAIYEFERFWQTNTTHRMMARQKAFIRRMIEMTGMDYTIIPAGAWIEYYMMEPVLVMGDADTKIGWSTGADVGRIIPMCWRTRHPAMQSVRSRPPPGAPGTSCWPHASGSWDARSSASAGVPSNGVRPTPSRLPGPSGPCWPSVSPSPTRRQACPCSETGTRPSFPGSRALRSMSCSSARSSLLSPRCGQASSPRGNCRQARRRRPPAFEAGPHAETIIAQPQSGPRTPRQKKTRHWAGLELRRIQIAGYAVLRLAGSSGPCSPGMHRQITRSRRPTCGC